MEGFQLRRPPDGHVHQHRRRAVDVLPGRQEYLRSRSRVSCRRIRLIAKVPSIAAYAFRHTIGRPYSLPDNDLSFAGNFLNMLFRMTELKYNAEPGARAGARRAVHPARRSRAELQHERDARHRQLARRSVLGDRRRGRRALRPAARRRQRGRPAHADTRSGRSERPGLHQAGEGAAKAG